MASFWENFAEAMGWGKANHTKHLSDISQEKQQEYRNRYVDAAVKQGESDPSNAKIVDVKNKGGFFEMIGGNSDNPFSGGWTGDDLVTKVFDFKYEAPTMDVNTTMDEVSKNGGTNIRHGKLMIRAPKNGVKRNGELGVYTAVLDDGTELTADQFKDFIYANPYAFDRASGNRKRPSFTLLGEDKSSDDKFKIINDYREAMTRARNENVGKVNYYTPTWSTNYRRWVKGK